MSAITARVRIWLHGVSLASFFHAKRYDHPCQGASYAKRREAAELKLLVPRVLGRACALCFVEFLLCLDERLLELSERICPSSLSGSLLLCFPLRADLALVLESSCSSALLEICMVRGWQLFCLSCCVARGVSRRGTPALVVGGQSAGRRYPLPERAPCPELRVLAAGCTAPELRELLVLRALLIRERRVGLHASRIAESAGPHASEPSGGVGHKATVLADVPMRRKAEEQHLPHPKIWIIFG